MSPWIPVIAWKIPSAGGHFETNPLPTLEGARQSRRCSTRPGPGVLGSIAGTLDWLNDPVDTHGRAKNTADRPLDVRAQC